jgi:hypothetical protein
MAKTGARGPDPFQAKSDVYTGLLGISLAAMVVAAVLLYLDFAQYGQKKPDPIPTGAPVRTQTPAQPGK